MQKISKANCVRKNTVQYLNDFDSQSLATQAKKRNHLVSMMPANKKAFDLLGVDRERLSTQNESLRNKKGSHDEK